MSRLVVSLTLLLSQGYPKIPWANILIQWEPLGTQKMVNRVMFFCSNIYFELYSKNFQIGFSQKGLAKKV